MLYNLPLKGLQILVTRPTEQAHELCASIRSLGGNPILFPTLEIVPFTDQSPLTRTLKRLAQFDWAIFTSKNAALQVLPHWPNSVPTKIAAIGASTAKAIAQFNIAVNACPEEAFSSEALLTLAALQHVKDQQIVIFTGENGRDLLTTELTQRGAQVSSIAVYRRQPPRVDIAPLLLKWQQQKLDVIISTSNESLTNLINLVPEEHHTWLLNIPLLVISPRMQAYAQTLGFKQIITATKASDQEILEVIKTWYDTFLHATSLPQ